MFTWFASRMDRLSENPHAQKCAWIFMGTVLGPLVPGSILSAFIGPIAFLVVSAIIFLIMVGNYGRLWTFTGPQLEAVETPTARRPVVYGERLGLMPISTQDDPERRW